MAIADWIRERTARNREKFRAEVMREGFELGRAEGRTEGRAEGYHLGYDDGRRGNPPQPPPNGASDSNAPT